MCARYNLDTKQETGASDLRIARSVATSRVSPKGSAAANSAHTLMGTCSLPMCSWSGDSFASMHAPWNCANPWTAPKVNHLKASHPHFRVLAVCFFRIFRVFGPRTFSDPYFLWGRRDNPHFPHFRLGRSELQNVVNSDRPALS